MRKNIQSWISPFLGSFGSKNGLFQSFRFHSPQLRKNFARRQLKVAVGMPRTTGAGWIITMVYSFLQIESNRLYIIDYYIDYIIIWRRIYRCISLTRNGASTSNFPPFFFGSRSSSRALMVYPTKGQDPAGVGHHGVEVKAMP